MRPDVTRSEAPSALFRRGRRRQEEVDTDLHSHPVRVRIETEGLPFTYTTTFIQRDRAAEAVV